MTNEEVDILLLRESRETILRNLGEKPEQVALRLREHAALLATQVKYLQRARTKFPSYYRAGCILPPLAFEQATSEAVAAGKRYEGELCVDLTCGLGVDSRRFSECFDRVVAVERDPVTARIAAANFSRLGISNVDVANDSAEHFLASFDGPADLIYVDPARRGDGNRKLFLLQECSPDVVRMMPELLKKARRVVVKASPLFDVEEAFRLFGEGITVEVLSLHGECKEVLMEISGGDGKAGGRIRATIAGGGSLEFARDEPPVPPAAFEPPYGYLSVPDVSLCKARLVGRYAARTGCYPVSDGGYILSKQVPCGFFGRSYPIREMLPYQPRRLKPYLKAAGIARCNILKKEFPFSAEQIARELGVRQGGSDSIAFTRIEGKPYALLLGAEINPKKSADDAEDR